MTENITNNPLPVDNQQQQQPIKVLEFYSGIGGMHYALKKSGVDFKVIGAFDINTNANTVYRHNFPEAKLMQKNLEGLTVKDLDKLSAQCWTMSPPCQPYTRQGKQEASKDSRAKSFLHIMDLLAEMSHPPSYVLIENVKGFDGSDTRDYLLRVLQTKGYHTKEFLVSPVELGIPNSRLRYYLLAKMSLEPFPSDIPDSFTKIETRNRIGDYLSVFGDGNNTDTSHASSPYLVPDSVLLRFSTIMDIVSSDATGSCCFTKAYGKYVEGTGSIYSPKCKNDVDVVFKDIEKLTTPTLSTTPETTQSTAYETIQPSTTKSAKTISCQTPSTTTTTTSQTTNPNSGTSSTGTSKTISTTTTKSTTTTNSTNADTNNNEAKLLLLRSLGLRYFSPDEIARLLCFPGEFNFPEVMTVRQRYQLLGNSVNVFTIAHLMSAYLFARR